VRPVLFVTVGISGSGKSTFAKNLLKYIDFITACPDDIRKELGNINNQENNDKVFSIARSTTYLHLIHEYNVFFSATSLTRHSREEFYRIQSKTNCILIFLIMKDSYNEELCRKRVIEDLKNKVNRSDTTVIVTKTHKDVIATQYDKFKYISIAPEIENRKYTYSFDVLNKKSYYVFISDFAKKLNTLE
jgi:predicted kinase